MAASTTTKINLINNSKIVNIYKVVSTDDTYKDLSECGQVMLLRRTKATDVESFLKSGFKPSQVVWIVILIKIFKWYSKLMIS